MSTPAEEQLKYDIWKAVYSDRLLGLRQDNAVRTAELVIETLKAMPDTQEGWFIQRDSVRIVEDYEFVDYSNDNTGYTVWVTND